MIGIIIITFTIIPSVLYIIIRINSYLIYGLGIYLSGISSIDTDISNSPEDKVWVASGIYKMASSLGGAFGIALSGALYGVVTAATNVQIGALAGLWLNVIMARLSFVIILLTVPSFKKQMKA